MNLDAAVDNLTELLFAHLVGDRIAVLIKMEADLQIQLVALDRTIHIAEILRNGIIKEDVANRTVDQTGYRLPL